MTVQFTGDQRFKSLLFSVLKLNELRSEQEAFTLAPILGQPQKLCALSGHDAAPTFFWGGMAARAGA